MSKDPRVIFMGTTLRLFRAPYRRNGARRHVWDTRGDFQVNGGTTGRGKHKKS